jgi:uncharacterized protein DUF3658
MIPPSEIDQLLLSFCADEWRKVARVIGKAMVTPEERGVQFDGTVGDQIYARTAVLVETGQLETVGNVKRWRYSEVRLPRSRNPRPHPEVLGAQRRASKGAS